jgi:uncharacterized protein (TIRG00374 family)
MLYVPLILRHKKKILKFILKLAVSGGFLAWVIFRVNWNEVWFYVSKVKIWQLALYLMVVILGMVISAYKWRILTSYKNINFSLFDHFKFYFIGSFINNFMPSFIGGDTYRAYQVGNQEKKYAEAASTVMMDRITGLIGATILGLIFALLNFKTVAEHKILLFSYAILLLSFFFDLVVTKIKSNEFLKRKATEILPEKIVHFLRELGSYDKSSHTVSKAIFLGSVFSFVGVALANYILFWALGIQIGILDYMSVIFLITVVSSIPVSINNIGIKEWAYITFFSLFGLNVAQVITVAILSRFLQMLLSFFALPLYLQNKKANRVKNL